jgi:uncharacterized protein (TIGR03067 family)
MFVRVLLLAGAVLACAADARDDEAAKKELKRLEGTWMLVSGEHDGKKIPAEHVRQSKITWKGAEVTVVTPHQSKEPIKATTVVHPEKKPAEMEWVRSTGPGAGQKMLAIYKWVGDDEYHICFAPPGKDRPKEFGTKEGTGHTWHVWKRVK